METIELKQILQERLPNCGIFLEGDGRHFSLIAVGDVFDGLSKLKSQQMIYSVLKEEFAQGKLHALEIQTFTKSAWSEKISQQNSTQDL